MTTQPPEQHQVDRAMVAMMMGAAMKNLTELPSAKATKFIIDNAGKRLSEIITRLHIHPLMLTIHCDDDIDWIFECENHITLGWLTEPNLIEIIEQYVNNGGGHMLTIMPQKHHSQITCSRGFEVAENIRNIRRVYEMGNQLKASVGQQ